MVARHKNFGMMKSIVSTFSNAQLILNYIKMKSKYIVLLIMTGLVCSFFGCATDGIEGSYDFELYFEEDDPLNGTLKIENENGNYKGSLISFQLGKIELEGLTIIDDELSGSFKKWRMDMQLQGTFYGDKFEGRILMDDEEVPFYASRQTTEYEIIDRSGIKYILPDNDLQETELNIDHAGIIEELDEDALDRGARIYNSNCINCHGMKILRDQFHCP